MCSRPSPEAGPQRPEATQRSTFIPAARQLEHRPEADRTPVPARSPSQGERAYPPSSGTEDLQHTRGPSFLIPHSLEGTTGLVSRPEAGASERAALCAGVSETGAAATNTVPSLENLTQFLYLRRQ